MQIVDKTLQISQGHFDINTLGSPEKLLIADIETTGLSPSSSQLYLIGCLYYSCAGENRSEWKLKQWFIQRPSDEQTVLRDFLSFCEGFEVLITFNGAAFDIPYLMECIRQYHLEHLPGLSLLSEAEHHIDLYMHFRPLKHMLVLPNAKLKSFETIIGIHREDTYTGFDLIQQYQDYAAGICEQIHTQAKENASLQSLRHNLLLHNEEDIGNIPSLLDLFSYALFFDSAKRGENIAVSHYDCDNQGIHLMGRFCHGHFPVSVRLQQDGVTLRLSDDSFTLDIPFYTGELKYYYEPYTNYYYLPEEDMAVHKKLAQYVDSSHRRKATRQTCYIRKKGCFLPQYGTTIRPCFSAAPRKASDDSLCFFEWTGTNFNSDNAQADQLHNWCCRILAAFRPKNLPSL